MKKIINFIKKPNKILIKLDNLGILPINDEKYLKKIFKERLGYNLDLDNPQTFNEKLQWLKLNDQNSLYTTLVDKYEVKTFVSKVIGHQYIIPTLGIYNSFDEINFNEMPNQFVIKCTHDSGGIVICNNKKNFNINKARKKINRNLNTDYYRLGREWPYKDVKPRIIIEKYMDEGNGNQLKDYKLMCFNGKVKCSFVCTDRDNISKGLAVTFFDINWNKLPFERHYRSSDDEIEKPKNYDKMIKLAEKLSKNIPFVRVDFYEIKGKIYFGELTFYPGSGFEEFCPHEWDKKLGDWIKII